MSVRARRNTSAAPRRPKFLIEVLEDRTVLANFATGAAIGAAGTVGVFDGATQQLVTTLTPYGASFTGGVNVAMGDVTGDGTADIITATATGGSHVKVFDGKTFAEVRSFLAFDAGFTGGVNIAAGDINKDGSADIVASAASGPPQVSVFSGTNGSLLQSFLAYDQGFTGGVRVAVGDINGDGQKDIVTGSGAGTDGNVRAFDGKTGALLRSFLVFTGGFNGGLNVGAGDLDGDGADEILVGAGPSAGPHVKAFNGRTSAQTASFFAFDTTFAGGVFVAVTAGTNGNDIAVGAIGTQNVKTFDGKTQAELSSTLIPSGTVSGGLAQVPTNSVPVLAPIGNRTGTAGQTISFTLSATDADANDSRTFSATGLPTGATLNPTTGAFNWTPTASQTGTFSITFAVTDGEAADFETVTFTIAAAANNGAPAITSNGGGSTAAVSVAENTTAVTTVTATDPNAGSTLTYSITGGADAARFTINATTGALSFVNAPDFENPTDVGTNNVYDVTVQVSDGTLTDTQAIAVTVTNANDAPTITSLAAVNAAENQTAALTVRATDQDAGQTLTYSITGGADQARFSINATTGVVTFNTAPTLANPADADGNNVYLITVQVSDGTTTITQNVTVTVVSATANVAPTITSNGGGATATVSVPENTTAVTTATATDPDAGQTLTYSLSGPDAALFTINPTTGVITFNNAPNFEAPADAGANNVYDIVITVTDSGTGALTDTQALAITVTNASDAPTITSNGGGATAAISVPENTTAVTTVTASDSDAGQTLTYSISGPDVGLFTINPTTGVITFNNAPNFESPTDAGANNVYNVTVQVSDGTLTDTQELTITVTNVNEAPSVTSLGAVNAAENQTAALTVTATDPDAGTTLTYALSGPDAARFNINPTTGVVTFITAPTLANPGDADGNNVYVLNVQVSDGTNTTNQSLTVTVVAATFNAAPTITSNGGGATATVSVAENQTAVTTATATDPDAGQTLTYSLSGPDAARFTINPTTGVITFNTAPNFEAPTDAGVNNVYNVTVTVTDSGTGALTDTQALAITVTNVNEAPTITSNGGGAPAAVTVTENQTAVTTVTATDPDAGTTLTYSISGPDAARFTINPTTGVLVFATAPNFENPTDAGGDNVYNVTVQVSDGTLTDIQDLTITVTNANEAPTITSLATVNAAENQTAVVRVTATDPDTGATLTYSITGGADMARFTINPTTGVVTFNTVPTLANPSDADGNNIYLLTVQVSDGTNSTSQNLTVNVVSAAANVAPVITSNGGGGTAAINVPENSAAVTTVTATDPDSAQTLTYSISGPDAARFTINPTTGALTFATAPNFEAPADAGANNVYDIVVTVTDSGTGTLTDNQTLTITVTNVNEAPTITSNGGGNAAVSVAENTTAVTTVTATDPDAGQTLTYSLTGPDAARFAISATGVITFITAPNFEAPTDAGGDNVYNVTVQVSDGTLTDTQDIAITVTNANEAPTITSNGGGANATVSVPENTTAVTTVTATDPDTGATLTYSLTGGADMGRFSISPTGVLTFNTPPTLANPADADGNNVYLVTVQVSDGTNTVTQNLSITVVAAAPNTAPTDLALSTPSIAEDQASGTVVGTFSSTDANAGDTFTYTLVTGTGDTDNGSFTINGSGQLVTATALDFETKASYSVRVRTTDAGGLSFEKVVTIAVTNVNEAPTNLALSTPSIAEDQASGTVVGAFSSTDPDTGDTFTYTLVTGTGDTDNGSFTINGSGQLVTATALDFETKASYSVRVRTTDAGGLSFEKIVTVAVTNVNEAPSITSNGGGANAAVNVVEGTTAVTTVTATDPDTGTTLTYSVTGGADMALFTIDSNGNLAFQTAPNFSAPGDSGMNNVYDVIVTVSDGTNSDNQAIAVTVLSI